MCVCIVHITHINTNTQLVKKKKFDKNRTEYYYCRGTYKT